MPRADRHTHATWRQSMTVPKPHEGSSQSAARHASRLAAVQAIYQMELTGADAESVTDEFIEHRFGPDREMGEPDAVLFGAIVRGVPHHQSEIDRAITGSLASGW